MNSHETFVLVAVVVTSGSFGLWQDSILATVFCNGFFFCIRLLIAEARDKKGKE
jgi:hypothetical protein